MDYRDTEDFARRMEAAGLREQLGGEAVTELRNFVVKAVRHAVRSVQRRLRIRHKLAVGG